MFEYNIRILDILKNSKNEEFGNGLLIIRYFIFVLRNDTIQIIHHDITV